MKKIILTLASSLFISLAAVNAQTDTTRAKDPTQQQQQEDQPQQQDRYRTEDMNALDRSELPEAVLNTLNAPIYEGWETGTFYLDPVTGLYIIEIEGQNELPVQHRFDKNGNVADEQSHDLDNQVSPPKDPTLPEQDQDVQNPSPTDPNRDLDKDDKSADADSMMMQGDQQEAAQTQEKGHEQQQQYRNDEMVVVETDDVPVAIFETLKDAKYNGWERKAVFLDPASGEYVVEVEKVGEMQRQFRFDRSGKDISDRANLKKEGPDRKKNQYDQEPKKQSDKTKKKKDY